MFSSSCKGLSAHQIWVNLSQGKQSYGGEAESAPPQVENVLNRPGVIGLKDPSRTILKQGVGKGKRCS